MTKYVLNSGNLSSYPDLAREFFREVLVGLGESPRLLICCFAQPREDWEKRFSQDVPLIREAVKGLANPQLELVFPATFEEQIQNADALYIQGGDDHLLQYWLRQFSLPSLWHDKVVATDSASSHALSEHFWTCDWRHCMDGLGILPIKYLAHFQSHYGSDDTRGPIDWNSAYEELKNYGDTSLPIHAVQEGEFIVIHG